jgi:hypothetical protein
MFGAHTRERGEHDAVIEFERSDIDTAEEFVHFVHVGVDPRLANAARYLDHAEAYDAGKLRAHRGAK